MQYPRTRWSDTGEEGPSFQDISEQALRNIAAGLTNQGTPRTWAVEFDGERRSIAARLLQERQQATT